MYTLFAIAHMNTFCLDTKCSQTLARTLFIWLGRTATVLNHA